MKVGYCFSGNWFVTKPELVKLVDELGFDGVEIWAQSFEEAGYDRIKEIMSSLRLEVASVNPYFDFTTSEETYQSSLKVAEEYLGYAQGLECKRLRVWASPRKAFASHKEAEPIHWERAIRGIRELCDMAAPLGITCVLEVHHGDGQLFDSSDATLRILEGVDRPNVTVNLQPPLLGEEPLESARRLGPHVTHLHAHNWRGGWGRFTNLEEGDYDFEEFMRILCGYGFDGYISLEHTSRDPEGVARHEIRYLRGLIARLEEERSQKA